MASNPILLTSFCSTSCFKSRCSPVKYMKKCDGNFAILFFIFMNKIGFAPLTPGNWSRDSRFVIFLGIAPLLNENLTDCQTIKGNKKPAVRVVISVQWWGGDTLMNTMLSGSAAFCRCFHPPLHLSILFWQDPPESASGRLPSLVELVRGRHEYELTVSVKW